MQGDEKKEGQRATLLPNPDHRPAWRAQLSRDDDSTLQFNLRPICFGKVHLIEIAIDGAKPCIGQGKIRGPVPQRGCGKGSLQSRRWPRASRLPACLHSETPGLTEVSFNVLLCGRMFDDLYDPVSLLWSWRYLEAMGEVTAVDVERIKDPEGSDTLRLAWLRGSMRENGHHGSSTRGC